MYVIAYNPETTDLEKTIINKGTQAAATQFQVKNANKFAATQRILVGEMGRERSEILTVLSVTNTQITTTAGAKFAHDADDPVYLLEYDQVRFYRSTTGVGGAFTLLTTVDIDVDNADLKTKYDDTTAIDSYFYQICYYDSVGADESERSSTIQATGYPEGSVGEAINDANNRVGKRLLDDFDIPAIIGIMNDVNYDMTTQAKRPYRFLKKDLDIDLIAGDEDFPYPADLIKFDDDGVESNTLVSSRPRIPKEVTVVDMHFRRQYYGLAADDPTHIAFDDANKKVLFNPAARTTRIGAFTVHYYKKFTRFTKMSDLIETTNNLVYKLAIWYEYYTFLANDDSKWLAKASNYEKRYQAEIMKLQREKNVKASGPKGFGPDIRRYRQ